MNVKAVLDRWGCLAVSVLFSVWALYLRFQKLAERKLWVDEINQLTNYKGAWKPFWEKHSFGDATFFQGDYWFTYPLIQFFGDGKWVLAAPRIILTIVGLIFLYKLCQRYFTSIWAYAITFVLVCFNYNLIWHGFEFRAYAVLPTLAVMGFYLMDRLFNDYKELSVKKKTLYGVLLLWTIWYNLAGMLIVASVAGFFIIGKINKKSERHGLKKPSIFLAAVILIALPLWLVYATGIGAEGHYSAELNAKEGITTFAYIPNPLTDIIGFTKAIVGNLVGQKALYFLLLGFFPAFLIPHDKRYLQLGFLLMLIVTPILITLLASTSIGYWFLQRQFVWVMPLFAFLLGWCWDSNLLILKQRFLLTFASLKN